MRQKGNDWGSPGVTSYTTITEDGDDLQTAISKRRISP